MGAFPGLQPAPRLVTLRGDSSIATDDAKPPRVIEHNEAHGWRTVTARVSESCVSDEKFGFFESSLLAPLRTMDRPMPTRLTSKGPALTTKPAKPAMMIITGGMFLLS